MFVDPTVGMVGAQKMAVNTPEHIVGLLSHLRLRMEHELCLEIPRLGEMIAFRKLFDHIPPEVAMDEAFVEALVLKRGMSVRYAPDAIVYNTGPDNIADFVRQRRRNHAGHLYLKHKYGYAVSSIQNSRVLRIAYKEVWGVIQVAVGLFLAGAFWRRGVGYWVGMTLPSSATAMWCGIWRGAKSKMCKMYAVAINRPINQHSAQGSYATSSATRSGAAMTDERMRQVGSDPARGASLIAHGAQRQVVPNRL